MTFDPSLENTADDAVLTDAASLRRQVMSHYSVCNSCVHKNVQKSGMWIFFFFPYFVFSNLRSMAHVISERKIDVLQTKIIIISYYYTKFSFFILFYSTIVLL